jgi:amino acid transporter
VRTAPLIEPITIVPEDRGLKRNAISFVSNVVIGVASTAPAYSLASALGLIAAIAGFGTPAIIVVAFIPMLFVAAAFYHMNRADPDCGITFSWASRALGPHAGWMGGWAIIVTDVLVMPSLAVIAGQYSFELFGVSPSTLEVTLAGVAWIVLMTALCYFGIELSARTQQVLLAAELAILAIFAVVALLNVYSGDALAGSRQPSLAWFNPFAVHGFDNFSEAVLIAVFIYWGWDCGLSINEETRRPGTIPGRAAIVSTFVLVATYVLVGVAALAFAGPVLLSKNSDDIFAAIGKNVLGTGLDKLLILAVLTSASASTQTTILPTARMALSMGRAGAIPRRFAHVHSRYQSPDFATLMMGVVSIVWYVGLTFLSPNVLADSIKALGLGIAFYYALTGLACVVYYRRRIFRNASNFFLIGLLPAAGALTMVALFVKSCFDLSSPSSGSTVIFGTGGPLVIGVGALLVGAIVMAFAQLALPEFFRRKPETAGRDANDL